MSLAYCDKCGATVHVGDYPFCPHEPNASQGIVSDELINFVQEHFGPTPEVFQSQKAMLKRADELGLKPMVRCVPGDKHLKTWAAVTQKTLDNARALVSRAAQADDADIPCESLKMSLREVVL